MRILLQITTKHLAKERGFLKGLYGHMMKRPPRPRLYLNLVNLQLQHLSSPGTIDHRNPAWRASEYLCCAMLYPAQLHICEQLSEDGRKSTMFDSLPPNSPIESWRNTKRSWPERRESMRISKNMILRAFADSTVVQRRSAGRQWIEGSLQRQDPASQEESLNPNSHTQRSPSIIDSIVTLSPTSSAPTNTDRKNLFIESRHQDTLLIHRPRKDPGPAPEGAGSYMAPAAR